jgi:hypothetical protein
MAEESARAVASTDRAEPARVLGELSAAGWRIFHEVQWPGRARPDIDHVLVGRQGVFVVETKDWSGDVEVAPGSLRVDGRRRTGALTDTKDAAQAVSALLPRLHPSAVHPVVCFVRPEPLLESADDVLVCSTTNIVSLLAARPVILDEPQVSAAAEVLGRRLRAAPAPLPPTAPHRPGERQVDEPLLAPVTPSGSPSGRASRRSSTGARLRRRKRVTGPRVAALLIAAFAALFFGSGGFERITELGAQALGLWRTPTAPIGESFTVAATDLRPPLVVKAERPVVTRSTTPGARVAPGHVLKAVRVSLRNEGEATWVSQSSLGVRVYDAATTRYRPAPGLTQTSVGTAMPAVVSLPPGKTKRFYVAFDVPRRAQLTTVELRVGAGAPKTVQWVLK